MLDADADAAGVAAVVAAEVGTSTVEGAPTLAEAATAVTALGPSTVGVTPWEELGRACNHRNAPIAPTSSAATITTAGRAADATGGGPTRLEPVLEVLAVNVDGCGMEGALTLGRGPNRGDGIEAE